VRFLPAAFALLPALATAAHAQNQGIKWWQPVLVVGAIATASLADGAVNDWVQERRTPQTDELARIFRSGGEPEVTFGIGGGILVAGTIAGKPELQRSGGRVLLSIVAAGLTTGAIKVGTGRYRPADTDNPYIFKPFSGHDSFPSGHATMARSRTAG
jgi:membrane-associated phospholipid phosphatase